MLRGEGCICIAGDEATRSSLCVCLSYQKIKTHSSPYFPHQNLSTWEKTRRPTVRQALLEMICFTGKQQSWDQMTLRMPEEFSFSISTFLRTIHSSLQRFISQLASTTVTSTLMEVSVWTFWRISGVLPWPLARFCSQSAVFSLIPILMTHWFQILLNSSKQTEVDMIVRPENGLRNTHCSWEQHHAAMVFSHSRTQRSKLPRLDHVTKSRKKIFFSVRRFSFLICTWSFQYYLNLICGSI